MARTVIDVIIAAIYLTVSLFAVTFAVNLAEEVKTAQDLLYLNDENPLLGLLKPNCVVHGGVCPDDNVTFWLYTKENREPLKLDPLHPDPRMFTQRRPVTVLIHGYTGNREETPNNYLRSPLLDVVNAYVISVDYGLLVQLPCYFAALRSAPFVGECLAQLLNNLVAQTAVRNEDLHLIGHSLGAHIAAEAANHMHQKLTRITGLDPAKPFFSTAPLERRLDAGDADFVDVVHTDISTKGIIHNIGHVDFYANFPHLQPGCPEHSDLSPFECSHARSVMFYAESITTTKGFWATHCSGWLHFALQLCEEKASDLALMGYYVKPSIRGDYFFNTAAHAPYALGIAGAPRSIHSKRRYALYKHARVISEKIRQIEKDMPL